MYCRFWQGVPLDQLLSEIAGYLAFSESRKNRWAIDLLDGGKLVASTLADRTENGVRFRLPNLDEETYIRRCHENANTQVLCIYAILKSEALYLLDDVEGARKASLEAQAHLAEVGTQGLLPWARHVFISALISARLAHRSQDAIVQRDLRGELERGVQQSGIWAQRNPAVFHHIHSLLCAELAFLDGKVIEAIDLGDAAFDAAGRAMCPQDAGIAAECVAMYWRERGRSSLVRHYIIEACHAFRRWGAVAKETQQRLAHPSIFDSMTLARFAPVRVDQTIDENFAAEEMLDLGTVLVATQTIFGEIILDRLLETFLRIAMENAGASRGFLILPKGEELAIAQYAIAGDSVGIPANASVVGGAYLSEGVVRQAIRTGLPIVLEDGDFGSLASDPYLAEKHPLSLACLPMSNRRRLVAIVYLENDLVPACFTPNRLALLRVLGTQAAIAIDNAMLYAEVQRAEAEARRAREHLADQVDARTRDLHEANVELMRRADELGLVGDRLATELSQREFAERERATLQGAVIEAQRARLLEMSTPIIPISDKIVVMPLIGVMDDVRAAQVMDTALAGVSARNASTMILDLTGMRHVDSSVARTLVDAANALRLLGCATILTGVRAEMARSITEVGLDLGQIITCATLQSGISRALGHAGRESMGKR
jgi:anti-anti-sigma regulatory factor/GAF domain-containing protein